MQTKSTGRSPLTGPHAVTLWAELFYSVAPKKNVSNQKHEAIHSKKKKKWIQRFILFNKQGFKRRKPI